MLGAKVIVTCFVLGGHSDFIAQESGKKHRGRGGGCTTLLKYKVPHPDPFPTSSLLSQCLFCLLFLFLYMFGKLVYLC